MLTGIGSLSAGELTGQRLATAFETKDQEDEHSCFSDNTHIDHRNDELGIENALLGRYGDTDGPGIDDLVQQVNPALADDMRAAMTAATDGHSADSRALRPGDPRAGYRPRPRRHRRGDRRAQPSERSAGAVRRGARHLDQQHVGRERCGALDDRLPAARLCSSPSSPPPAARTITAAAPRRRMTPTPSLTAAPTATATPAIVLGDALSGGEGTVFDSTIAAFAQPSRNLPLSQRTDFFVGNALFNRDWVTAPSSTDGSDGLGPVFNARSCSSCHFKDGRGRPPIPPEDDAVGLLFRLSIPGVAADGGPVPDPAYGSQLNQAAILRVPPEGAHGGHLRRAAREPTATATRTASAVRTTRSPTSPSDRPIRTCWSRRGPRRS